ncbi:flagellin [Sphingopyxis yananensis]|uniref:flagellin n=1 Tax=Sphingopyxis yananensis TaxID=2886687 RepID=UPI001D1202E3|nr:flagellin [Sphingopyxis yananensis]MCC2601456.1 flagellin-like protein [Sphingopyxis yananensis]
MINAVGNRMTREISRQQRLASDIEKTQIQISSSKRLQRMSDDPVASRRISTINAAQSSMSNWQLNLTTASGMVSQGESVMKSVSALLQRVNDLSMTAVNGTMDASSRQTISAEIQSIADEIDNLTASRGSNGEPLFSAIPHVMRFDTDIAFAPLPAAGDVFAINGVSLSASLRDVANNIATGNEAGMGTDRDVVMNMIGHVADQHAGIGLAAGRLDRIAESLDLRAISVKDERSGLEDTDLAEAISLLKAQDLTLSAAQATFAQINRRTLFDILS